ncbi:MAG: glutathione peroxidase [Candidatus Thiodiazotropha sp. 6PLUC2]
MRIILIMMLLVTHQVSAEKCPDTLNFDKRKLADDSQTNLCDAYSGKVVLIVNTASKCGFTPQYDGLEQLYRTYKERGLVVLGFPSNDFGSQEPGSEKEIQSFCRNTYSIEFPMFEKTVVRKGNADPLYQELARQAGEYPAWNFHKYLLNREGELIGSFPSQIKPESQQLVSAIKELL